MQSAIDHTGRGGRIVLGSWYGSKPAPLSLGIGLHPLLLRCPVPVIPAVRSIKLRIT